MSKTRKYLWGIGGVLFVFFVIGLIVDAASEGEQPPPIEKVRTVTKTKTIKKPYLSDACRMALEQAGDMAQAAGKIADVGNPQLDILSDARLAIHSKDMRALVKLSDRQTDLSEEATDALSDLLEDANSYDLAAKGCQQAQLER
jgi:hypothetical protein